MVRFLDVGYVPLPSIPKRMVATITSTRKKNIAVAISKGFQGRKTVKELSFPLIGFTRRTVGFARHITGVWMIVHVPRNQSRQWMSNAKQQMGAQWKGIARVEIVHMIVSHRFLRYQ